MAEGSFTNQSDVSIAYFPSVQKFAAEKLPEQEEDGA